jgi:hypothetical protein
MTFFEARVRRGAVVVGFVFAFVIPRYQSIANRS